MSVITSLNFFGNTEAAIDHYRTALGAEILFLMRFRDAPDELKAGPDMDDLIFHATFRIRNTVIMASDVGYEKGIPKPGFSGFALALRMQSFDQARRAFDELAAGGRILMALSESELTSWYGMVVDRFGISWKIIAAAEDG